VTPHVVQNITPYRGSNIDGRTTRHHGCRASQVIRKRIEATSGWIKEVGRMAQTKFRGVPKVGWMFTFKAAAYNLICLPGLLRQDDCAKMTSKGWISGLWALARRSVSAMSMEKSGPEQQTSPPRDGSSAAC